jgi:hypothetical protein
MHLVDGAEIWRVKASRGLPLDFAFERLAQSDAVPTWDDLIAAARRDGANIPRLVRELQFFVREAYRPEVAGEINARLEKFA